MSRFYRFEASWGGIRIDVTSSNTNHGRRMFGHEFPKKRGASTEDKGRRPQVINLEFLFIDRKAQPGEDVPVGGYEQRFEVFNNLVKSEDIRTLVHPYLGQIRCRISNYSHSADGEGQAQILCSATFTEDNEEPPILDIVDGAIQVTAGSQAVLAARNAANDDLAAAGFTSALPDLAFDLSASWELSLGLTTRTVQTEMAALNARLNAELNTLGTATNIELLPIMRSYTLLQFRLRKAAEAFSTTTPRIVEITVEGLIPLRIIAAEFYGAEQAEQRFLELLDLNPQLRTPACVQPGQVLKAFSRTVRSNEFRTQ